MIYNPHSDERLHHFIHLTAAFRGGAPWHEIAGFYRNGLRVKSQKIGDLKAEAFTSGICDETGIRPEQLLRMLATRERVELFAGSSQVANFLSDDLASVEVATRIAWHDAAMGRTTLLDLKDGKISKSDLMPMLESLERRDAELPEPPAP